jgi:hypothetical protein
MSTSIKFNGKEIDNPIVRIVVVLFIFVFIVVIVALFGLMMPLIVLGVVALVAFLTVPLHLILRLCGRRGFYLREGSTRTWTNKGAFGRR